MATRNAQIIINVDDKSLEQLNSEIKDLQKNINGLKVGTQEWVAQNEKLGKLKNQFTQATTEARKLQNVVQKVGGAEQLRSVAKLGAGLVGAFSSLSGTIKLFGGSTEKFDEMTAKATTLMATMGGLNQIAELFSKTNLRGLAAIGTGFKSLVTTVRAASLGIKAALISTGIGALIVGVGLLIANFEKIKNLLGVGKAQKQAEETYKLSQQATKLAEQEYQTKLKTIEANQKTFIIGKNTKRTNEEFLRDQQTLYDVADAKYNLTLKQLQEEKDYYETIDKELKGQSQTQIDMAKAVSLEKQKTLGQERDIALAGAAVQLILTNQAENTYKITESLRLTEIELTKTSAQLYSQQKQYDLKLKSLKEQKELIRITNLSFTDEVRNQLDALDAQIAVLEEQEMIRKEALKNSLLELNYEKVYKDLIDQVNSSYQISLDLLKQEVNQYQEISTYFDQQIEATKDLSKQYELLTKKREELSNFDKKGLDMFNEQNAGLIEQLKGYDEIYEQVRNKLELDLEGKNISEKLLSIGARELSLYEMINDAKIQKLEYDKQGSELEIKNIELQKEQLVTQDKITQERIKYQKGLLKEAQTKLESSKSEEERKARLEEVYTIEGRIGELNQSLIDNKTKTIELDGQIVTAENEILKTNNEINKTADETVDKQKEITGEIENQSRAYEKLQGFVGKYGEEIDAATQAIGQSIEFVASLFDRKSQNIQDDIDRLNVEYDNMVSVQMEKEGELDDLRAELADANGVRYDEILAKITQAELAGTQAFETEKQHQNEIAKLEHKRLQAERTAAQWRKAQAIIEAVVQGALAFVKALPNVFLAAAVGVLSAASIGTIIAQKIPEVPPLQEYEEGGYTGDGDKNEVAGVVHKRELVVPSNVVENPYAQGHIMALENMRVRGFQDGGYTSPNITTDIGTGFNYDRLIVGLADAISKMPPSQVSLVAVSNGIREVQMVKNNAGLSR